MALSYIYVQAQAAQPLQKLDDLELADSTGEGIALLPENFSFRMNGADSANNGEGTYGAGNIRLIPVGPLTQTATDKGYKKADIYINGVSLGQSKKDYGQARTGDDWGTPFGAIGTGTNDFGRQIDSWGTAINPWVLKTLTENVPNFVGASGAVPYLSFEAPLLHQNIPTTGAESSAYNLKFGLYLDAFRRDDTAENGYSGLDNRLRLAAVWDGFSINGSQLKVFRTQGGVTSAMGGTYIASLKVNNVTQNYDFKYGLDPSYNQTFGLSGVIRLNSGYTNTSRATVSNLGNINRNIYQLDIKRRIPGNDTTAVIRDEAGNIQWVQGTDVTSNPNTTSGILQTYTPPTTNMKASETYNGIPADGSFPNNGMCQSSANNTGNSNSDNNMQCFFREGITARRFVVTSTNTWTPPTAKSVLRISTQELLNSMAASGYGTPALGGANGYVPNFKPNNAGEGIFLYDANINLVLGSLSQPLIFNASGNNFSFELTRIPNVASVYQNIYQKYSDTDGQASGNYLGNTCNIHKCGGTISLGGTNFQDSKATHSSISIGSTNYDAATNSLTAYKGLDAYGVSIGALNAGTGLTSSNTQDFTQVWNARREKSGNGWTGWQAWQAVEPKSSTNLNPNAYESVYRQNTNGQILGINTTMPTAGNANLPSTMQVSPTQYLQNMTPSGATVSNNLGSVAIDGLLIQHLKFTTTGL